MDKNTYLKIEEFMLGCIQDSAHDCQHIYRVLYHALDIASKHKIDIDVLVAAALLHDIGRKCQGVNEECDHAIAGGDMAFDFLISIGWAADKANHVRSCIASHRFKNNLDPESMEAKIIFDSDKLDSSGCIGLARNLLYGGIIGESLYSVDSFNNPLEGKTNEEPSFFKQYNRKLKNLSDKLYTQRAREIARELEVASKEFYKNLYSEVTSTHIKGIGLLNNLIKE